MKVWAQNVGTYYTQEHIYVWENIIHGKIQYFCLTYQEQEREILTFYFRVDRYTEFSQRL